MEIILIACFMLGLLRYYIMSKKNNPVNVTQEDDKEVWFFVDLDR